MVDTDSVDRSDYCTWTLEEGIKCACYLRRAYEEIRQQKLFKEHCYKLLSNYSGFGPLRKGIKREIDEARSLRTNRFLLRTKSSMSSYRVWRGSLQEHSG